MNILYLFFGVLTGIFTCLFPGIHPNNIAVLSIFLLPYFGENFVPFLIGLVISHYFINFIPAAFLGVPDDETSVSVLPLHKLTLKGYGYEGVILSGLGAFLGVAISLVFVLIVLLMKIDINTLYLFIKPAIPFILILFVIYQIITAKHIWEIAIIFLSGIFGIVVLYLNYSELSTLTAIFTGMFGVPILLNSLNSKFPKQNITFPKFELIYIYTSLFATVTGFFRIFLPAVSGAQLNFLLSKIIKESNLRSFLVSQGAIILSNEVLSLLALIFIGKGRSGVAETIRLLNLKFSLNDMIFYIIVSSAISFILLSYISKFLLKILPKINFRLLSIFLIIFCTLLVLVVSKYPIYNFIVYLTAIFIGILANKSNSNLSNMMNVLVFPTILLFLR